MTDEPPTPPATPTPVPEAALPPVPAQQAPTAMGKSRAELLAERGLQPPEPEKKRSCFWCGHGKAPRHRRGDHLGLVLLRRGELDTHKVRSNFILAQSGAYVVEGPGFLVTKTIPKGTRLSFWCEGDPEPVTSREPKGYGSGFLARILGGTLSHALRGIFTTKGTPLSPRARIALLIGLGLLAAGGVFLWLQRHKGA